MGSVAKALWAYLAEPNVAAPVARTDGGIPLLPAGLRDILGGVSFIQKPRVDPVQNKTLDWLF